MAAALLMAWKPWMAKVDGNTHETAFQNGGIELTGQMVPLRKRQREDIKSSSTKTVSR